MYDVYKVDEIVKRAVEVETSGEVENPTSLNFKFKELDDLGEVDEVDTGTNIYTD